MARIRTLKPEFWADEKLGPLTPVARLVFLGLISQADDAGRLIDSVKLIDGLLFPYTDDTCADALDELSSIGVIRRGKTEGGQQIIQVVNWHHQKIDRPNLSAALDEIYEDSEKPRRSVDEDSSTHISTSTSISTNSSVHKRTDTLPVKPKKGADGQYEYPAVFERAWAAYPSRDGSNPKVGAYSAFRARAARGADPEVMAAAAENYRADCQRREKEGTEFVMQAATFYGPREPWREFVEERESARPTTGAKRSGGAGSMADTVPYGPGAARMVR